MYMYVVFLLAASYEYLMVKKLLFRTLSIIVVGKIVLGLAYFYNYVDRLENSTIDDESELHFVKVVC